MVRRSWSLLVLSLVLGVALAVTDGAAAQQARSVEGAPDFRTAPTVASGSFVGSVRTGLSVWYSFLYTNNGAYELEATLQEPGSDPPELFLQLLGPTLNEVGSGGGRLEGTASYSGAETNRWFVKVSLGTEGELGVPYTFTLKVVGANPGRLDRCDALPDCDAQQRLNDLTGIVEKQQTELNELGKQGSKEKILADVAALKEERSALAGRVDGPTRTPVLLVLLLIAVLAALIAANVAVARRAAAGSGAAPP